jgi:hypothetical protein
MPFLIFVPRACLSLEDIPKLSFEGYYQLNNMTGFINPFRESKNRVEFISETILFEIFFLNLNCKSPIEKTYQQPKKLEAISKIV